MIHIYIYIYIYTRKPCVGTPPTQGGGQSKTFWKQIQLFFECRVRSWKFRRFWGGFFEPSSILPLQLTIKKKMKNFSFFFWLSGSKFEVSKILGWFLRAVFDPSKDTISQDVQDLLILINMS